MTHEPRRRRDRRPQAAGAGRGAEGLVLVRLGQLRLRHHHRHGPLRRRTSSTSPRTPVGRRGRPHRASARASRCRPARCSSTSITFATILSASSCRPLGALADRTANKKRLLARFAWAGSVFAALLFFATGDNWQLGAVGIVVANLCLGAAGVVNDSILPLISDEDERDRVSSRGWAFGYLGGGLLLVAQPRLSTSATTPFGLDEGLAARLCMLSAARLVGRRSRSSRSCGSSNHPPVDVEHGRGQRCSGAASASWPRRCATCATTR